MLSNIHDVFRVSPTETMVATFDIGDGTATNTDWLGIYPQVTSLLPAYFLLCLYASVDPLCFSAAGNHSYCRCLIYNLAM